MNKNQQRLQDIPLQSTADINARAMTRLRTLSTVSYSAEERSLLRSIFIRVPRLR